MSPNSWAMAYSLILGWPRAYEDQAERAVRAALDAIAGVEAVHLDDGEPLQARIGIASGEVVVGDLIGDSTNRKRDGDR